MLLEGCITGAAFLFVILFVVFPCTCRLRKPIVCSCVCVGRTLIGSEEHGNDAALARTVPPHIEHEDAKEPLGESSAQQPREAQLVSVFPEPRSSTISARTTSTALPLTPLLNVADAVTLSSQATELNAPVVLDSSDAHLSVPAAESVAVVPPANTCVGVAPIPVLAADTSLDLLGTQTIPGAPWEWYTFTFDFAAASPCAVLALLLLRIIDIADIVDAVVGSATLRPYAVVILFFSLSYVCLSLDATDVFCWLALKLLRYSGPNVTKLFLAVYVLSSAVTLVTSNDIVILTLTPIILHFTRMLNVTPTPFLIMQFFAANTLSAALYVGNPTNIIVADAIGMDFGEYSRWMTAPAICGAVVLPLTSWLAFRSQLQGMQQELDSRTGDTGRVDSYRDRMQGDRAAAIGGLFLLTILVMATTSAYVPAWVITFASACFCLVLDLVWPPRPVKDMAPGHGTGAALARPEANAAVGADGSWTRRLSRGVAHVRSNAEKMPWKAAPFVIGMFVLVQAADKHGIISLLAGVMRPVLSNNLFLATLSMGVISSVFANLLNNQPMTIAFAKVLQDSAFVAELSPVDLRAAHLALALGSNYGANFTLIGALAGLMWIAIVRRHGHIISASTFSIAGIKVMPLPLFASCLVLYLEMV